MGEREASFEKALNGLVPVPASVAPCARPSRPLRARRPGGVPPVLTAALRGALPNHGRGGETALDRTKKRTVFQAHARGRHE
jgi:hypothetical protein